MDGMNVLVHGSGKYGRLEEQLLASLESAASTMRKNGGVLLWWKDDLQPNMVRSKVQKIFRLYIDEIPTSPILEDEDVNGENPLTLANTKEGDNLWGAQVEWKELLHEWLDHKELVEAMEKCHEESLTQPRIKKCTVTVYLYLTIYRNIIKHSSNHHEAFMKNGNVRQEYIYERIAEQMMDKKPGAAKKRYIRCLAAGSTFGKVFKKCLAGHSTHQDA